MLCCYIFRKNPCFWQMRLIYSALRHVFKIWQYERDEEVHQKHVCFSEKILGLFWAQKLCFLITQDPF